MKTLSKLLLLAIAPVLLSLPAAAGSLSIKLDGIRSDKGQVYIAVHTAKDNVKFPGEGGVYTVTSRPARPGELSVVLNDLPEGRYAVTAFHDENGNGELDMNMMGMPTEGYGFSNNAVGHMGPPSFDAAAVAIGEGTLKTVLTFSY